MSLNSLNKISYRKKKTKVFEENKFDSISETSCNCYETNTFETYRTHGRDSHTTDIFERDNGQGLFQHFSNRDLLPIGSNGWGGGERRTLSKNRGKFLELGPSRHLLVTDRGARCVGVLVLVVRGWSVVVMMVMVVVVVLVMVIVLIIVGIVVVLVVMVMVVVVLIIPLGGHLSQQWL